MRCSPSFMVRAAQTTLAPSEANSSAIICADAAAGAGDDRDLAGELAHGDAPPAVEQGIVGANHATATGVEATFAVVSHRHTEVLLMQRLLLACTAAGALLSANVGFAASDGRPLPRSVPPSIRRRRPQSGRAPPPAPPGNRRRLPRRRHNSRRSHPAFARGPGLCRSRCTKQHGPVAERRTSDLMRGSPQARELAPRL